MEEEKNTEKTSSSLTKVGPRPPHADLEQVGGRARRDHRGEEPQQRRVRLEARRGRVVRAAEERFGRAREQRVADDDERGEGQGDQRKGRGGDPLRLAPDEWVSVLVHLFFEGF